MSHKRLDNLANLCIGKKLLDGIYIDKVNSNFAYGYNITIIFMIRGLKLYSRPRLPKSQDRDWCIIRTMQCYICQI
jgi:hypothetical protein